MVRGRVSERVAEDVMDWFEVKRKNRRRTAKGKRDEKDRKSGGKVQIFVKVDGSRTFSTDVSLSGKVGDVAKWIPN